MNTYGYCAKARVFTILTDFAAPKSSTARNILHDYTYHLRVKLARIRAEHKEKETLSGWQP